MELYRKNPIVIQAEEIKEVIDIETLEGVMTGNVGDFLIIGVNGEKYPCKPDIFHKTYTKVNDNEYSEDQQIDELEMQLEDFEDNYQRLEDELLGVQEERDEYCGKLDLANKEIEELKQYLLHTRFDLEDALAELEEI